MSECRLKYDDVGSLTQESVSALVAYVGSSAPASPSEPSDAGASTASLSHGRTSPDPPLLTPEQAAIAWIHHLKDGGDMPERDNLIGLLEAFVTSRAPRPVPPASRANEPGIKLVVEDTGKKFPHMLETENGRLAADEAIWTQCKTKMTHFCVKLVDANGRPVKGEAIQPGGIKLRLTMHKVSDDEAMHDGHNPRPHEGLFLGRAAKPFEPEVLMTETRHEYRFQVLLLSSDIGGARMYVKVAPVDPELACNPNLVVQSHSFISRARMPDETYHQRERQAATSRLEHREQRTDAAATHLLCMAHQPPAELPPESPPKKRHCSPEPTATSDAPGDL